VGFNGYNWGYNKAAWFVNDDWNSSSTITTLRVTSPGPEPAPEPEPARPDGEVWLDAELKTVLDQGALVLA